MRYYLFNEYELHYNEIPAKTKQDYHHHEKVWETLFVLDGKLTITWKEKGSLMNQKVQKGDLIEMENSPHNIANDTKKTARFIIIKQVLSGKNKKAIFRKDKVND